MVDTVKELLGSLKIAMASDLASRERSRLTSNSEVFTRALNGGLPSYGPLVELIGDSGAGKTQLLSHLIASVLSGEPLSSHAVLFYTGVHPPLSRIASMCERSALSRLFLFNVTSAEQLLNYMSALYDSYCEQQPEDSATSVLKLVAVDCLTPLLQAILSRNPYGHSMMESLVTAFSRFSHHGVAVIVVNNTVSGRGNTSSSSNNTSSSSSPAVRNAPLGATWQCVPKIRCWVVDNGTGRRQVIVVGETTEAKQCTFTIVQNGIHFF